MNTIIDNIIKCYKDSQGDVEYFGHAVENELKKAGLLKRETGRWYLDPNGMDWNLPAWRCNLCGGRNDQIPVIDGEGWLSNPYNWSGSQFCPCCGAKMEWLQKN